MKTKIIISNVFFIIIISSCVAQSECKHLFILSGQSNMLGVKPEESFIPTVEAKFGKGNVIVVKDALGGQPILRWYKGWKSPGGNEPKAQADLYDSLLVKINSAIESDEISTVTFIWMQGERDAKEKFGRVYKESLIGLYNQLCIDLNRNDINFVIGRLSDFGNKRKDYPHWALIRKIQVKVAKSNPRFDWINTDDLNDGINRKGKLVKDDLHMTVKGYNTLGKRFANASIQLIEKSL